MTARTIIKKIHKIGNTDLPSLIIFLPTSNGQLTEFTVFDDSEISRKNIGIVNEAWDDLWPKLERLLLVGIEEYGTNQSIKGDGFLGTFDFTDEPGSFMNDKSHYQIGFHFAIDVPGWDAFVKGSDVVHFQPIY